MLIVYEVRGIVGVAKSPWLKSIKLCRGIHSVRHLLALGQTNRQTGDQRHDQKLVWALCFLPGT